ncbi:MAG: hypothetical protein JWN24_58 [Phycisphaerales bacterium]|nr:hypothetical protein [Phycisphaerales bacterium]
MTYRPGDTLYLSFVTQDLTGAATNADSLPTAVLRRNGANTAVTVTVVNNAAGDYTASALVPLTFSGGDDLEVVVSATIAGVAGKALFPLGKLDRTAQAVAQVVYRSSKVHFITATGDPTHDGFSPETAKALPTQPTPGAGETLLVFSGTFAMGTTPLDLSGDGTTGVHLLGAGMGATTLSSNALLTVAGCIVKPGNGSQISDLTVLGTAAGGLPDQYQSPIGSAIVQTPFTGAVVRRANLVADSDGFYFNQPSSLIGLRAYDCIVQTKYDALNLAASAASLVELFNCEFTVAGPSTCNSGTTARALVTQGGTVNVFGGSLVASNGSSITRGVQTSFTGIAFLQNVKVRASSATGTAYDLDNGGLGIGTYDCDYSPAHTNGAIGVQNTPGILASTQNFDNTGQHTPVPATTAFTGPNSVTLVFHDTSGNPVPNVLFTLRGTGSASTDVTGIKTISLPSGTYTVQVSPTSGTLWPDTPITVTTDATFTFTGTAVTIPPASSPAQTTAYLTTRDGQGNPLPSVPITFQLIDPQASTDTYDQGSFTATSDIHASLQVPLLKSTKYQARLPGGPWVVFTTGTNPTFALPEILGTVA